MILKKKFKNTANGETLFAGFEFVTVGANPAQHIHLKQLKEWPEGVATVTDDAITLHCLNGDQVFKIEQTPGIYCLHDGKRFELDGPTVPHEQRGQAARDHVAANPGKKNADPANPSGYRVQTYYATTLEQ